MTNIDKIMEEAEQAYFKQDDLEKVLELTEKAIEMDPTDIRPIDLMGVALFEKGFNDDAIVCYDKILELNPDHDDAKLKKGQLLTELKKYDDAIAIFDQLIDDNSEKRDEALIAKLTLDIENENEEDYQKTVELCKKIMDEEDSKILKNELEFIESIHSMMMNSKNK